ncbi:hypothetical protein, partial [Kribbella ginsengisoli]|uniref:hypothetical protein n=1 Tax=Kribbella ginsengisoli TaxID=363865 RepID=UPI0031CF548E
RLTTWQSTDPALPSTATNTTSLSTYLYANANPINYTDPDGREPKEAGTATVYIMQSQHFAVEIRPNDGRVVTFQSLPTSPGNLNAYTSFTPETYDPVVEKIQVRLPNAKAAADVAEVVLKQSRNGKRFDVYDRDTNSCVTPIGRLLRIGGADAGMTEEATIPKTSVGIFKWIKKNGTSLSESGARVPSGVGGPAIRGRNPQRGSVTAGGVLLMAAMSIAIPAYIEWLEQMDKQRQYLQSDLNAAKRNGQSLYEFYGVPAPDLSKVELKEPTAGMRFE